MPTVTPGKTANAIDRNAVSPNRIRRNWQRLTQGAATGTITLDPNGGIGNDAKGLTLELQTPSGLILGPTGLAVNPDNVTITINGSNQLVSSGGGGGSSVIYSAQGSAAITNTTSPTVFSLSYTPTTGLLNTAGKKLRWTCYFSLGATNSIADTLTLDVMYGSTVIATFNAVPVGGFPTGTPLQFETVSTTLTTGATGTVQVTGLLTFNSLSAVIGLGTIVTTLDLTSSFALQIRATWSAASANDSVTMDDITIEDLV